MSKIDKSFIIFVILGINSVISLVLAKSTIEPANTIDIHGFLTYIGDYEDHYLGGPACLVIVNFDLIYPEPREGVYLLVQGLTFDRQVVVDQDLISPSSWVYQVILESSDHPDNLAMWYVRIEYYWWSGEEPVPEVEYFGYIETTP